MNALINAAQTVILGAVAWIAGTAGLAAALLVALAAAIHGRKTR